MKRFSIKPKAIKHYEFGGFIVDFYADEKVAENNFATINTISKNFSLRITGYPFGYLLASVKDGETENLHGFCAMMYLIADGVYQDPGLANDLMKSITKYQKRLMREGASRAKAVTPEQIAADEALMSEVAVFADATPKQRKQMRKQWKEDAREALREDKV